MRNRNGAEVQIRSIGFIDRKLARAGPPPLVEGRIIHERKAYRLFDFVDILAGEENRGTMRIDAGDGLAQPMRRGIRQKGEDIALVKCALFHTGPFYSTRSDP